MKLTKEEAESLFEQLEKVLRKKKINLPIPNWPYTEPAPTIPIPSNPYPSESPVPWWPNYPSYPQVWCGQSMFPKGSEKITVKSHPL